MSLVVETGTASPLSESYASVEYCDTYHANMGNALWASLQIVEKEQALRRAASFLCQRYRHQWKGSRVSAEQALDWPRYDVSMPDLGAYSVLMPDVVPDLVQKANAELAYLATSANLNPNTSQAVVSKQIGPIKIVYDQGSPQVKNYVAVWDTLRPLLENTSNFCAKLRRT